MKDYRIRNASKDMVEEIFDIIDMDGGGTVEYSEFIVTCINYKLLLKSATLENMFKLIGPDANRTITSK